MIEKVCSKCKESKSLEDFKKAKGGKYGRSSWCKKCHSKETSKYQKENRDKANKNNEKYKKTENGVEAQKRYKRGLFCKLARKRYNEGELGKEASKRWRHNRKRRVAQVVNNLTKEDWMNIVNNQNGKCSICKKVFDNSNILTQLEKDHIIPLYHGGGSTKDNIQALCRSCNSTKGIKL